MSSHGKNWRSFPRDIPGWCLRLFDPFVHAITVMDHEHRVIHDGMTYHATDRIASLANGATLDWLISVPAGTYPHMTQFSFQLEKGDVDILTYEGVTTSADGTPITTFNRNRNSLNEAETLMFGGPTVTDLGTEIHDRFVPPTGSGVGSSAGTLAPNFGEEWILKPDTKYLIRLTNNSGSAIRLAGEVLWYEADYIVDETN